MENVCHTLCGLALARAGGDRLSLWASGTMLIAANLPDSDIVTALYGGKPTYMCHHRGITHAVIGLAVESVLLAALVYGVGRWAKAAHPEEERPRFLGLWAAAGIGLVSHLLLDGLNTYGIRPWLPFSETWYYSDTAFIVDPWLWLLFGGGALLAGPRTGWGNALWWAITAFGAFFVWAHPRSSWGIALPWTLIAGGLLAARWRWPGGEGRRALPLVGIGLALVYLSGLQLLSQAADARARSVAGAEAIASTTHPSPGVPWIFTTVVDTGTDLRVLHIDLLRDTADRWRTFPTQREHPVLQREDVRASRGYAAWKVFARHPWVAVQNGVVVLGDGRYSTEVREDWCNFLVPLAPRDGSR